jgi:hypothetical protein
VSCCKAPIGGGFAVMTVFDDDAAAAWRVSFMIDGGQYQILW